MPIITGGKIIEGTYPTPYQTAGAPTAGTNEVQTLTIGGTPTAGTFKVALDGNKTGAVTWSATNATLLANLNTALDGLPWGASAIVATAGTLTAGIGTILLTFSGGALAKRAVNTMTVAENALTGTSPTLAIAETTPGVDASALGAPKGAALLDTTNGVRYLNTGTDTTPTWTAETATLTELSALAAAIPTVAVADIGALTVGADLAAFTDPPSAAEMALLRASVNAQKADSATIRTKVNALLAVLRTAGIITP